jgi:photosystem II stability/assembly factor-like uncharacterized protein
MKLQSAIFRHPLLVLAVILALPALRAAAQSSPDSSPAAPAAAEAQAKQSTSQPGLKPLPHDGAERESVQEGSDFLRRRQDWFFQPRAYPLGFVPQGARQRALQRMHQMLQNEGRLSASFGLGIRLAPAGPTTSAWQFIGPQGTNDAFSAPFTSGRVTALIVNPNNANNVYIGGADGGLWVTTDAGTTWTPLTDFPTSAGIASVAVGSLATDASTCASGGICTTIYVGTGEDNFNGDALYGEGVLKCTVTAGSPPTASCTQDNTFRSPSPLDQASGGPFVGVLAVNPKTSGSTAVLLAAVRGNGTALPSGIYCSADAGVTWKAVFGVSGIVPTDAVFANDGTAFVALGNPFGDATNNGIYKSTVVVSSCTAVTDASGNPGATGSKWAKQSLPAGTPAASLGRIALAILPISSSTGSNATLYAAIADSTTTSSNLLGVIKTTNGGTSAWTQLAGVPPFCNAQCFYDLVMAVDPADTSGKTVFAGGAAAGLADTLMRSTDGGTTWTEISGANSGTGLHVDTHALGFSSNGSVLYVGNDGGVWSSATNLASGTTTWNNLNANLGITQFYPGISIHTSTPLLALGGTQDNDVQEYQGPSLVWQSQNIGCDGGFTAIDPAIPSTIYGECEYLQGQAGFPFILVSFTGQQLGNGFLANTGISNADRGSFIPPLVMDLKNPLTLYFGTCRVWQTKDGANTWTAISPDVTTATHPAGCAGAGAALSTIAPAPSNSTTVYTGSDSGEIEVTADGGTTWTSITTAALPTRSITQIAVDPSNNAIAYVTFSGFGSCAVCTGPTGHVFKTLNSTLGAATVWTDIDGSGLPDIPVNAILIDPDDPTHNTLYVGTDIGAFFTVNGGASWSVLGTANSLPPAEILALALHDPSRTLRVATHGRGMWDLNLGGAAAFSIASISPFTANAGAASITNFTVNGSGFTSNSVVNFAVNGTTTPLATSCTTTSCTATIPMAQLQSGGAASITVTNTSPAGTSNALPFTILNPVPAIVSISPTTTTTGTTNFSLTANGSSIICGGPNATVVLFNLSPRSNITACSATSLTVKLPDTDLSLAGAFPIDLSTPQPGGGPDINRTPPTLTITQSNNPVPAITTLAPSGATAGGPAFTLTVNGSNFVGTSVVSFAGTARTTTFVSAAQLTAPITAADIASAGNPAVIVTNPTPGGGTSNSVAFPVTSPGSFTVAGAAATVTAGSSGNSAITVTPSGGFTGAVAITCGATVPGVTCSALNVTVPSGGGNGTGSLPINVKAPSAAGATASVMPQKRNMVAAGMIPARGGTGWWILSAGTGLAAIILLLLPGRKRFRAALGLGLVCLLSFTLGCGGYSGGGNMPVATVTHITVTSPTKAAAGATFTFTATVTGGTPTDMVQLMDGGVATGSPVAVVSGTATLTTAALSTVGTHSITAHYAGDATYTQASTSGALSVTVMGTVQLPITGTAGSTTASSNVSLTIN